MTKIKLPSGSDGIATVVFHKCDKCQAQMELKWTRDLYARPQVLDVYCRCGKGWTVEVPGGWNFQCRDTKS